ncbi:MAG: murein biosynthesis integral membrane protein MurJ [Armatimonadota bacterium]|nr:murein biosynthesis integral membrane protein MurJ [Armatimonadota bacterium]
MDDATPAGEDSPQQPGGATSWMADAAILMMFATLMSAITGLLREAAIGHQYGRGYITDAFYNALTIPDFLYFLVAGGALRTGFVPVFTELMARGQEDRAWRTFSTLFWLLAMVSALLAGAGMLLAEPLAHLVNPAWAGESTAPTVRSILTTLGLIAPGQEGNPEPLALCAAIMRLLFPAQIFFLLGGLLMGTLNARRHFFWPAMGPIIYNLAIITAALVAPLLLGPTTLGYGALAGAMVGNFAVQMVALRNRGGRLQLSLAPTGTGVRRVLLLAFPVMLGLAIAEINFVVTKVLANVVDEDGGVSTLNYANRLWKLPARVIGAGIAIALFPALAEHYARDDPDQFQRDFSFGIRNAVFLTLPATALIMILAEPSVRLLWPRFTDEGVWAVAVTLLWFSAGIVPLSLVYIAARAFYARHDTMTPVWIGAISVAACITAAVTLDGPYRVAGLAMATSISGVINATLLLVMLQVRVGGLGGREIARSILRMIPPTALLTLVAWGSLAALEVVLPGGGMGGMLERLLVVFVPMGLGALAFIALARTMRLRELQSAWRMMARRFNRGGQQPR